MITATGPVPTLGGDATPGSKTNQGPSPTHSIGAQSVADMLFVLSVVSLSAGFLLMVG